MKLITASVLARLVPLLGLLGSVSGCDAGDSVPAENVAEAKQALNAVSYVSGKVWYVDGNPWLMKGVNWDPSEVCEWYTQYNWGRAASDAEIMKQNGFNTIRTYGFTSGKTGLPENGYMTTGQLDAFYSRGVRVILAVHSAPGDSTWTGAGQNGPNVVPSTGDFTQAAKDRITQLANHPAVIALGVGNEIHWNYFYTKDPGGAWSNGWTVTDVIGHANYVTNKARALTDKPITVSWGNTGDINRIGELNADIISYQIYNQLSLDNIFNLHPQYSGKPFYMSEFGSDAWNANVNGVDEVSQRVGNNTLFKLILDNATTGANGTANHKIVGGTVFSFSDGWWKGGNPCGHESGGIAPGGGPYPDLTFNEEYWGLCTGGTEDNRTCRQTLGDLKTLFAQYPSGGGNPPPPPSARSIASNLEAESNDGMFGVQFEGCTDTGAGQNAGWIEAADYIDWRISVPTTGSYKVTSRSASTAAASYSIKIDGTQVAVKDITNTGGWQSWQSFSTDQFNVTAGIHTLRVTFTSPGQNLNWVKLETVSGGGGGALTGTIEGEAFNSQSGVSTETCSEGGTNLKDIGNNEWAAYNNVALTGVTSFEVRVASNNLSGNIEFRTGSATGTLLATCNAPFTGGWQNWQTVSCNVTTAATGNQTLYLVFKGSGAGSQQPNVNWFKPVIGGTGGGGGGTGAQPTRLRITNQCAEPIWIAHGVGTSSPVPDPQNIKIESGASRDYNIPTGRVEATRFMPRTGCDASGLNCKIGQSVAPCPTGGCQPPVESKFEATFGSTTPTATCPGAPTQALGECVTWYNASFVDGYTLPMKVIPKISSPYADCQVLDASNLRLDNCPGSDNLGTGYSSVDLRIRDPQNSSKIVGCLSPCKRLNFGSPWGFGMPESQDPAAHMCCPTPYPNNQPLACTWANGCGFSEMCNDLNDPKTVVHTNYVKSLQTMAPTVYSYAYDDADSLRTCHADTKFEVIYCPGGSPSTGTIGGGGNPATCTDHIQNQGEVGVDCGGPCPTCATCSDGVKNQNEVGIDCGGACAACATCSDGVQNQGETGVDCGGPCSACVTSGDQTIQAEAFSANGGVGTEACSEGGLNLKDVGDGEWVAYGAVNLNSVTSFQARVSSAYLTGTIEFRRDNQNGTLLGTCSAPVTGGWQTWTTVSCTATGATGVVDLYLVFHGSHLNSDLPNVNWIKLVKSTQSCTPTTCSAAGKNCGSIPNGCGGTLSCGSCSAPQSCGGGGTSNVCGCSPITCADAGKNCGSVSNGCGGTLSCGNCTSPQTCGGGGTANVCGGGGGGGASCWPAFDPANWATFTTGVQVSRNGANYTCANANCANAHTGNPSCYPGATGCPWGTVWNNNGACQ